MEAEKWNGVPEVLNIKNLSIQFGDTNFYAGGAHHDGTKGHNGDHRSHEDPDADDDVVLVSIDSLVDESEDEDQVEGNGDSPETAESSEAADHEDAADDAEDKDADYKSTDHEDTDDAEDKTNVRSGQPSWSTLLYAMVKAITAEELLKAAKKKGEDHGNEK